MIRLKSENAKWFLVRLFELRKHIDFFPWFLKKGMMADVHKTLDSMEIEGSSMLWKTHLYNLFEDSAPESEFPTFLITFQTICEYCNLTLPENSKPKKMDYYHLKRIRMLWRQRAYRYANKIVFKKDHDEVVCYSEECKEHIVTRAQLNLIYDFFDVVAFALFVSNLIGEEETAHLLYQAKREVWPFESIFRNISEDASPSDPNGVKGNVLSLMTTKYGFKRACNVLRDVYLHKEEEPLTNILHMVATNNPEILTKMIPFFADKWVEHDISGNSVLDNALFSKNFEFATCGNLLVQCDDSQLNKLHYCSQLPVSVLMLESADLTSVFYIVKRILIPYHIDNMTSDMS